MSAAALTSFSLAAASWALATCRRMSWAVTSGPVASPCARLMEGPWSAVGSLGVAPSAASLLDRSTKSISSAHLALRRAHSGSMPELLATVAVPVAGAPAAAAAPKGAHLQETMPQLLQHLLQVMPHSLPAPQCTASQKAAAPVEMLAQGPHHPQCHHQGP